MVDVLWKEARVAPADGITFSGKKTEGAPQFSSQVRELGA
jgi:hypothetical protein